LQLAVLAVQLGALAIRVTTAIDQADTESPINTGFPWRQSYLKPVFKYYLLYHFKVALGPLKTGTFLPDPAF
jgi:hypothetical protein